MFSKLHLCKRFCLTEWFVTLKRKLKTPTHLQDRNLSQSSYLTITPLFRHSLTSCYSMSLPARLLQYTTYLLTWHTLAPFSTQDVASTKQPFLYLPTPWSEPRHISSKSLPHTPRGDLAVNSTICSFPLKQTSYCMYYNSLSGQFSQNFFHVSF